MYRIIILYVFIIVQISFAQEQNISSSLKSIESGNTEAARQNLDKLKKDSPDDPSVKFLEAVLTEDGELANALYEGIYINHPESKYADASLYRIFSYYYARGIYGKAEELKSLLKKKYPSSPYLKAVDRTIPDTEEEMADEISKPAVNITTSGKSFSFTIQAGAFLNNNNARALADNFKKDGYVSSIFPKEIGGSIFNVVTVGRYTSRGEAENFLAKLKSDYKLEGRIIPIK